MKLSLIVLGTLAVTLLMRRRSAALRHWVLAAGIACAAASPLLATIVPVWRLPFGTPAAFVSYQTDSSGVPAPRPVSERMSTAGPAPAARVIEAGRTPGSFHFATMITLIWAGGVAVSVGILLIGMLRLSWLAKNADRVTDGRWANLAREISETYGLRRSVTLFRSRHPSMLVTWGVARPKVILPATADEWSDERARVVMSHELAHIRRGDWLVQLSAEVLRAFYWFNPLIWVACRRLRLESEHACDDEVMNHGVEGTDYATHLVELARALNARRQMWLPAPAMARPSSLERRVRAMLNHHRDRGPVTKAARSAIFALLFAVTAAIAAAQGSFVSFTGRITDEQGRGVSGVPVTLGNDARQAKYEVKTTGDGRFEFVGLPSGQYKVEVIGMGFRKVNEDLTIGNQNVQRDFRMRLGTLQETVNLRFSPSEAEKQPVNDAPNVGQGIEPAKKECVMASPEGGYILPPKKIRDARPYYPSALRGVWTEGTVVMEARIGVDGYVADVNVIGSPQPDLAQSAVAAVREWRYTETLLNCTPVEVTMTVTVNFTREQ
jgi:TonB family protein